MITDKHILSWSVWQGQAIEDLELWQIHSLMTGVEYKLKCYLDDYMPDGVSRFGMLPITINLSEPELTFFEAVDRFDKIKAAWQHWFDLLKREIERRGVTYRPTVWIRGY